MTIWGEERPQFFFLIFVMSVALRACETLMSADWGIGMQNLGARVYGIAAIMMGVAGLMWGAFAVGWIPWPTRLPAQTVLVYVVGVVFVVGGAMINVPRTAAWGAGVLTALFAVGAVLLDLAQLAMHLSDFSYWESSAEQVALAMGGLIAYAMLANPPASVRLQWIGRMLFGLCLLIFGAAHFVFAKFSATFVPSYIPPSQLFWVYATGVAQAAAGVAILSNVVPLLATRLLVVMYILFGVLVHTPRVLSATANHGNWQEFIVNLALVGVAWIVADSMANKSRLSSRQ